MPVDPALWGVARMAWLFPAWMSWICSGWTLKAVGLLGLIWICCPSAVWRCGMTWYWIPPDEFGRFCTWMIWNCCCCCCCCEPGVLFEPAALIFRPATLSLDAGCWTLSLVAAAGEVAMICQPFPVSCAGTSSSCCIGFWSWSRPWLGSIIICCCVAVWPSPPTPPILLHVAASNARGDGCASYTHTHTHTHTHTEWYVSVSRCGRAHRKSKWACEPQSLHFTIKASRDKLFMTKSSFKLLNITHTHKH